MNLDPQRLQEQDTVSAMIRLYCRKIHGDAKPQILCPDCHRLEAYAKKRLEHCPHGSAKPTCANCKIHCYGEAQRAEIRKVMRFSGPRMLLYHPWLSLSHALRGFRK